MTTARLRTLARVYLEILTLPNPSGEEQLLLVVLDRLLGEELGRTPSAPSTRSTPGSSPTHSGERPAVVTSS